jgi:hypothetical protein
MLRITTAAPRFLPEHASVPGPEALPLASGQVEDATVEDVGEVPPASRLADAWADVREVWGQAMAVLNDPGGWR